MNITLVYYEVLPSPCSARLEQYNANNHLIDEDFEGYNVSYSTEH